MKIKSILSVILCISIALGLMPFMNGRVSSATDAPKDIYGNEWSESLFANWEDGRTQFSGENRVILVHNSFQSYGSTLKDGKYPLVDNGKFGTRYTSTTDNFGKKIAAKKIPLDMVDLTWTMRNYGTDSSDGLYTFILSDGKTYLKDNTGSLPTSGGDLSVTTDRATATIWNLRYDKTADGFAKYKILHKRSGSDPYFTVNESGNQSYLDLSKSEAAQIRLYVEMEWLQTKFCFEDGTEYKQDTRQTGNFTVPAGPEKTGYIFEGWTDSKGGTDIKYKAGSKITPTSSKSYYPVYTPVNYTVRYYSDSTMTGEYKEQKFKYGASQKLLQNTFTSPGAVFAYWQNAGNSSKYSDGETVSNLSAVNNFIVNLYAVWNENSYTVNFYPNYGSGNISSKTVSYSENFTLPDENSVSRKNYTLVGWNTNLDGSGNGYAAGGTVSRLTAVKNGTVNLYAVWSEKHVHSAGDWETVKYATCVENGERVKKCTECGGVVESETISAPGHLDGEYTVVSREASCNSDGEKVWYCTRCNLPTKTEVISAKGHTDGAAITKVQATCTQPGIRIIPCKQCGATLREEAINALGHDTGDYTVTKHPTCTESGLKIKKCTRCFAVTEESVIDKKGHTPGAWRIIKNSTCTESGLKMQSCSECDALIGDTVVIDPHKHKPGSAVTYIQPTCTKNGEQIISCTECGGVIHSESIGKTGHTAGEFAVKELPTCCKDGLKVQECETCGTVLEQEIIPATGHIKSEFYTTITSPYCNGAIQKVFSCEKCGVTVATEAVSAMGHKPGIFVTVSEPDCTKSGYREQKCEICGLTISQEELKAYGHKGEVWITNISPTCVTAGEKICNCEVCGNTYKTEPIEPLKHTPGKAHTCVDSQICDVCGTVIEKPDGKSHTWAEWITEKEAAQFWERKESRYCSSCGKVEFRYVLGSAKCHESHNCADVSECKACKALYKFNTFIRVIRDYIIIRFLD